MRVKVIWVFRVRVRVKVRGKGESGGCEGVGESDGVGELVG